MISGVGDPLPPAKIGALCELLGKWDPGGDGFRYPCALDGQWYTELAPLNLRSLGKLAGALTSTVLAYKPG